MMNDYVLILNAGSSSLKFCVFRPPRKDNLEMVVRGQIEGIGGAATLSVKDADGNALVSKKAYSEIGDALGALDVLAEWLRAQFTECPYCRGWTPCGPWRYSLLLANDHYQ